MIPRRFFWLFDLLVLTVAFLAAYLLLPQLQTLVDHGSLGWLPGAGVLPPPATGVLLPFAQLLWILFVVAPVTLLVLEAVGGYRNLLDQSFTRVFFSSLLAPLAGLSGVTLVLFALKSSDESRLFIFSFLAGSALGLLAYRLALRSYFLRRRAAGYYRSNVVLVGLPSGIEWMCRYLGQTRPAVEYSLLGYLDLDSAQPMPQVPSTHFTSLGTVEHLGSLLVHRPIHEVIAIHPVAGGSWINQVVKECEYMGVVLRIVPEALLPAKAQQLRILYPLAEFHLPAVVLNPPHLNSDALYIKRLFDIAVSATALLVLAPLFVIIAITIKLTTPQLNVFYPWRVVGKNGVEFTGYKFTTMRSDADVVKVQLLAFNEMSGPVFKMKDDPRVTPLGRILRKFSLNELPQLWSVFKGDMSLVGPRPAFRHELERYEFWHKRKLSIRPGITCLWQVRGRNKISNFDDWVRMDLEYIDNWSLWLDCKILLRTAWAVVGGTGS